jgi:uncharacterized protein (UPF0254 family)
LKYHLRNRSAECPHCSEEIEKEAMPDPGNEAETGLSSSMDENEVVQDAEMPVMDRIESLFMIDPPTGKNPKITLKVQESDEEDEKSEDEDISSLF